MDVVRGEVIETATAESDVEEETWQREYEKAFGCPPPMEKLYDDEVIYIYVYVHEVTRVSVCIHAEAPL